jgi:hypothetical protein
MKHEPEEIAVVVAEMRRLYGDDARREAAARICRRGMTPEYNRFWLAVWHQLLAAPV